MSKGTHDLKRPYLVIPKLVEQPTWGGRYIAQSKGWHKREPLDRLRIGQSYELYSGSNLSLLESTDNPAFKGEVSDRDAVAAQTHPESSIPFSDLLFASPEQTLGHEILTARGPNLQLLIKYTQALGNSFQVHIKDGVHSKKWKPKPESWYYFEPGLVTLGVRPDINWDEYQQAVTAIEAGAIALGRQVAAGHATYASAKAELAALVERHDPWRFVNSVGVDAGQLVDLSSGGLHHSWEEDPRRTPLGNVLYEISCEALDKEATFRVFDKGKMEPDGTVRALQIEEYFKVIDRTPELNDPRSHIRRPKQLAKSPDFHLDSLLETRHYNLDRLTLHGKEAGYEEAIKRFKHLFVRSGRVKVSAGSHTVTVGQAHSCFVPAGARTYTVTNLDTRSEVLISY